MEVKHCKAQHEVLLTFIRYTLHFWGAPWGGYSLSYWLDHTVLRTNSLISFHMPPELKLVLTRAEVLSKECRRPLSPLIAALRHFDRSQAFTDIIKEIQWCLTVVAHAYTCEGVEGEAAPGKFPITYPREARIGDHEKGLLQIAEQQDRRDLVLELKNWNRDHECTAEECGNMHGRSDTRFCLAKQLTEKWSGHNSDHLSLLWSFNNDSLVVSSGRLLGSGSFSAVIQSMWLGIEYAQKVFSYGGLATLQAEAEALARLNHPHIVKVYAFSKNSLLLDLMSTDLQKFIEARMQGGARSLEGPGISRFRPFSRPAAMDLMLQIADAVGYLHSHGIAHRDLKSSNILVDPVSTSDLYLEDDGYVFAMVADFGLAKVKHEMTRYSHCTHNVGTRRYMAPEIFGANKDDDHLEHAYPMKADVYSFGIICSEILSGMEPFSDVPLSLLYSKLTAPIPLRPQLPYDCPKALASMIRSCWHADPRERPTFADVCGELRCLMCTSMSRLFQSMHSMEWSMSMPAAASLATAVSMEPEMAHEALAPVPEPRSLSNAISFPSGSNSIHPLIILPKTSEQQGPLSPDTDLGYATTPDHNSTRALAGRFVAPERYNSITSMSGDESEVAIPSKILSAKEKLSKLEALSNSMPLSGEVSGRRDVSILRATTDEQITHVSDKLRAYKQDSPSKKVQPDAPQLQITPPSTRVVFTGPPSKSALLSQTIGRPIIRQVSKFAEKYVRFSSDSSSDETELDSDGAGDGSESDSDFEILRIKPRSKPPQGKKSEPVKKK